MLLYISFIIILVSNPILERGKRKSFQFWGPRGEWAKPRGKSQAPSSCPSTGCLPGKHLCKLHPFKISKQVNRRLCTSDSQNKQKLRHFLSFCVFSPSIMSSIAPLTTCLALMMLLIKCGWSVGGFAWQAWCLSFEEISPPLDLSTSHSPTQQCWAVDT